MKKITLFFLLQALMTMLCVAQDATFNTVFQKSQVAYEAEEYEQAIPLLEQAQTLASNDAQRSQAALLLGQCHLDLGYYPKAIPLFRFAVTKAQDNNLKGDALVALAWALHIKGHPDSSQVLIEQAKKTWNNAFPDAEREVHWSCIQGMIWIALGKEKEPLELFKQAKARIEANPKAVSAYEQARLYAWLAGRYSYFGWEGSKRTTLVALRKAMAVIPKQEIRWGHIALDASGLFEYKENDALTKRLEKVYTQRLGAEHLLVAYAKQARVKYLENETAKCDTLLKIGKTIEAKLGNKAMPALSNLYSYSNALFSNKQYQLLDSITTYIEKTHEQERLYKGDIYIDRFDVLLRKYYQEKNAVKKVDSILTEYENLIIKQRGKESVKYMYCLGWKTDVLNWRQLDTVNTKNYLKELKSTTIKIAGDSSFLLLNIFNYYKQAHNFFSNVRNETMAKKVSKEADSLATKIYGKDSYQRIDFLYYLANNTENKEEGIIYKEIKQILKKDTIMKSNKKASDLFRVNFYLALQIDVNGGLDSLRALIKEMSAFNPSSRSRKIEKLNYLSYFSAAVYDYSKRKAFLKEALENIAAGEKEGMNLTSEKLSVYSRLAEYYRSIIQYDSARYYIDLEYKQDLIFNFSNPINRENNYRSACYHLLDDCDAPYPELIDTLQSWIKFGERNKLDMTFQYYMLSYHYNELGNKDVAKIYALKVLEQQRKQRKERTMEAHQIYSSWIQQKEYYMGFERQKYLSDTVLIQSLLDSALQNAVGYHTTCFVYNQMIAYRIHIKQYEKSLYWALKSASLIEKEDYTQKMYLYSDLLHIYFFLKQEDKAKLYLEKLLLVADSVHLKKDYLITQMKDIPGFWVLHKQYERAIVFVHKEIAWLKGEQMEIFDEKKVIGKGKELPRLYDYTAWTYRKWYDNTKQNSLLDSAYKYSNYALQSIKAQIKEAILTDKNATENLKNADVKLMYHEKMQIELRLAETEQKRKDYWQREAYKTCNSAKASSLLQAIRLQNIPIPKDVLADAEAEKKAFREIIGLEKALDIATGLQPEQEQRLKGLYEKRTLLLNNIKQKNRKFYDLRYEPQDGLNMADVQQKLLNPEQVLIEYFLTDSVLTTFVIRKDSFFVRNVPTDVRLQRNIKIYNINISKSDGNSTAFRTSADTLYQILVAPIRKHLNKKELVIIADKDLGTLNFELLMSDYDKKPHYMIEDFVISNNYSVATWQEMLQNNRKQSYERDVTIVLPSYVGLSQNPTARAYMDASTGNRGSFDPLQNGEAEGIGITKEAQKHNYSTKTYKDEAARKDNLEQQGNSSRTLHFIGHSKSNKERPEFSMMVFSYPADSCPANFLMVKDIYKMQFPCELATLSSCETGVGLIDASEGLITLGRAFATAGCKSMCLSLWSVDDAKTKDLMVSFYERLFQGERKDYALRNAKLAMLKANIPAFYWAAFNVYGDMQPLRK